MKLIDADKLKQYFFRPYSNEELYSNLNLSRIIDEQPEIKIKNLDPHLKGYIYDSLVYRYITARNQMAEYEYVKDSKKEHDKAYYQRQANRDIMRFCQILHEGLGEHD